MKKTMKRVTVYLFLSLFLFTSNVFAASTRGGKPESVVAPHFNLKTMKGQAVSLADLKGKNVIIFFFTTWCPWCRKKIPSLVKNEPRYKSEGIELLLVDVGESQAKVFSFASKNSIPFDILLDRDMKVSQDYDVVGVPTVVLISGDGRVVYNGNDLPSNYKEILERP